jgi:hypothetical protein
MTGVDEDFLGREVQKASVRSSGAATGAERSDDRSGEQRNKKRPVSGVLHC